MGGVGEVGGCGQRGVREVGFRMSAGLSVSHQGRISEGFLDRPADP